MYTTLFIAAFVMCFNCCFTMESALTLPENPEPTTTPNISRIFATIPPPRSNYCIPVGTLLAIHGDMFYPPSHFIHVIRPEMSPYDNSRCCPSIRSISPNVYSEYRIQGVKYYPLWTYNNYQVLYKTKCTTQFVSCVRWSWYRAKRCSLTNVPVSTLVTSFPPNPVFGHQFVGSIPVGNIRTILVNMPFYCKCVSSNYQGFPFPDIPKQDFPFTDIQK